MLRRLFSPPLAGAVLAAVALAAFAAPARADVVRLHTGDVLTGDVVSDDGTTVVLDNPVLGMLELAATHVATVERGVSAPPPALAGTVGVSSTVATAEPPDEGGWKWSVEAGVSGSEGNTETSDLHAAIKGVLDNADGTLSLGAGYARGETADEKNKDEQHVEGQYDWKIEDSRWFPFVRARMDWDDFQDWDRRASVAGGVGYRVIEDDTTKLTFRVGLAGTREWGGEDDGWRLEGLLGGDWEWKISETQTFGWSTTVYPDLEDSGEYRALTDIGWSVKLDTVDNLSFKLGVHHEYDTHRESPFERDDLKYFGALLYEF